ncbi:tetratricopeptide repeat protein [bacterium]|nr:tetratricopeptide repeat protein [bacterium]
MNTVKRCMSGKGAKFALWGVLITAVSIRVVYLVQLGRSDLEWLLPLDMHFYRELAERLSSGEGLPGGALSFNPLYPFFLSVIFRVSGNGLLVPRIIQALLGVFTIYLHYVAGKEIVKANGSDEFKSEATGIFAAAMALFYPHFLLYEGSLLATSIVTLLLISTFVLAIRIDHHISGISSLKIGSKKLSSLAGAFLLGVLMGVGALGRPNLFFLLIPAVVVWLFFRRGVGGNGCVTALFCTIGAAVVLSLPIAFNAAKTGRFVPVTSHGGINFYIGNRPGADGVYKPPKGMRGDMRGLVKDARKRAQQQLKKEELTDGEASEYWFGRTVEGIREDPTRWLNLLGRKFFLFWNKTEIPDVIDISFYKESCSVMNLLFIPFSIISVLAIMGLFVLFLIKRNRAIFTVFMGSAVFSVLLFYINSRYRIVSVPIFILSASVFFSWILDEVRKKSWKKPAAAVFLALALFFVLVNREMVKINRSAMYAFLGNQYMSRKNEEKAERAYSMAYELDPGRVGARINYARILNRRGKPDKARLLYESAFKAFPDFPHLAIEYGVVLESLGEHAKAGELYRYAYNIERAEGKVLACKYLSRAALSEGKRDRAVYWIRKALEVVPGDEKLLRLLNRLETP